MREVVIGSRDRVEDSVLYGYTTKYVKWYTKYVKDARYKPSSILAPAGPRAPVCGPVDARTVSALPTPVVGGRVWTPGWVPHTHLSHPHCTHTQDTRRSGHGDAGGSKMSILSFKFYIIRIQENCAKHITGLLARSYCGPSASGSHIDRASLRNARPSSRRRAQPSSRGLAHRAQASAYGA